MNNVYEYLLTIFKVLVGLVTTQRLIYASLIAIGVYLIWIVLSLVTSFQSRFNTNCTKLYNFIKKNQINATNLKVIDMKIDKISSGFAYGWKNFKNSNGQKPSDFITRREALDVEVSGGVLNQGKTFMRAYINTITILLFIINFAYRGAESKITAYLIAETMVLPFIFFAIIKIFYFLYTSIKQQIYKMDIESFYELVGLLDQTFGENVKVSKIENIDENVTNQSTDTANVQSPLEINEQRAEPATGEEEVSEMSESEVKEQEEPLPQEEKLSPEEEASQKYDFFKKKNIDVDKLINEVPDSKTKTSLPYINVDSEYVSADSKEEPATQIVADADNGSDFLGGMMQDKSSIKKAKEQSAEQEKLDETKSETENEKKEEIVASESNKTDTALNPANEEISDDPFASLGEFEVAENSFIKEQPKEESKTKAEESEQKSEPQAESGAEPEPVKEESPAEIESVSEELVEDKKTDIANIVGSFKSNKSKLANGGVVIERNTPITKRTQPTSYAGQSEYRESYDDNNGITELNLPDNSNNVLNTMKGGSGFDAGYGYQEYENYPSQNYGTGYNINQPYNQPVPPMGQGGYSIPTYQGPITGQFGGYGSAQFSQNGFNQINQNPYMGAQNQGYNKPQFEDYEEEYEDDEEEEVEIVKKVQKKPASPKPKKTSPKEEPRPRNLKKKTEKVEETMEEQKKRGRPKKQVFDETLSIKNDKEFDEVLARAEKLMRKSDEGLSQSQSKRIEKELKMLMDAMNKYKEGK